MRPRILPSAVAASALLTTGVLVGASLDGDPGPAPGGGAASAGARERAPGLRPVAWQGDALSPATSCEDLLDWYVDRAEELVTPWGWSVGWVDQGWLFDGGAVQLQRSVAGAALPETASDAAGSGMTNATQSGTGTNVQEAGVDEPDVAKSDGELLVRVEPSGRGGDLVVADVSGTEVRETARLDLPDVLAPELLLVGDTVVVVGGDQEAEPGARGADGTRVLRVDVSDPAAPTVTDTSSVDSELLSVRQHGSTLRMVTQTGLPDLDFARPGRRAGTEDRALARNLELVRSTTVDDWLPHVTTYAADGTSTTGRLLGCDEVALPADPAEADGTTPGTVAITGLDATLPLDGLSGADGVGVAVGTDLVYASLDRLYLASSARPWACCWGAGVTSWRGDPLVTRDLPTPAPDGTSELHEFTLEGTTATYTASGEVDGTIRDRWSIDEHDGILRVAVGPSIETGDFSSIVALQADGEGRLREVGRVDRIGPREDIEAVRWFGDLALVVTFRRIDPLYTVDLSDPTDPAVVGELKVPGYSAYLHPLGPHRLLGLGEGPVAGRRWGAQTSLFDLADLTAPRRLDVHDHRVGTRHVAATDPRAFTWLPGQRTALSVVTRGYGARTGWLAVLRLEDGVISQELLEVAYGSDVDRVRLVRLPDTRVLLVTADDASFLEVSAAG